MPIDQYVQRAGCDIPPPLERKPILVTCSDTMTQLTRLTEAVDRIENIMSGIDGGKRATNDKSLTPNNLESLIENIHQRVVLLGNQVDSICNRLA